MPIISAAQAGHIVKNLSDEQLLQKYHNPGTFPLFVIFSEMQERMQTRNSQNKIPTETVAERIAGGNEPEGIAGLQQSVQQSPRQMYEGGPTSESTLTFGFSEDLPPKAREIIAARLREMKKLEKPDYNPPQYAAEGDLMRAQAQEPSQGSPISNKDIARIIMPSLINVESGGRQSAVSNKGATGVAQLMPTTAPEAAKMAGVPWDYNRYKNDPTYNATLGHAYLTSMLDRFGDREKALAAYNAGPGRVAGAIQKAQSTGGDWRSYLPRETQAYIGKVLGGAQRNLPERQTPEGADLRDERAVGYDPAFGGGRDITPPPYQYDRRSPLLDPSKMPSESSIDKRQQGIAQLELARRMAGMRRGPSGFAEGGAVYLEEGSVGQPVNVVEEDFPTGRYSPSSQEETPEERINRLVLQQKINEAKSGKKEEKEPSFFERLKNAVNAPTKDIATYAFGARTPEQDADAKPTEILPTRVHGSEYSPIKLEAFNKPEAPYVYPRPTGTIGDYYKYERPSPQEDKSVEVPQELRTGIAASAPNVPEGPMQPGGEPEPYAGRGIGGLSPFTGAEPPPGSPEYRKAEQLAIAGRERDAAFRGPGAGGKPLIPGMQIGEKEADDMSFKSVMKQVQDTIGSKIPEEMQSQMKDFQKNLKQMQNDKIVDTLLAAAKTFAGQRVGQRNFGDAVANAGLAAQEAQKRIYKAEDDMRKYRMDMLKAKEDGDYKAANIAMSRLVHADNNKTTLQAAIIQAQRAHATAEMQMERYKLIEQSKQAHEVGLSERAAATLKEQAKQHQSSELLSRIRVATDRINHIGGNNPLLVSALTDEQKAEIAKLKSDIESWQSMLPYTSDALGQSKQSSSGNVPPPPSGFKVK